MTKKLQKKKAVLQRSRGESIGRIARQLGISKSTASLWCRNVQLTQDALKKLERTGGSRRIKNLQTYVTQLRFLRTKNALYNHEKGKKSVGRLNRRDVYLVGLGLYWGEGYKSGNQECGFTNSDPALIQFYIRWLRTAFNVTMDRLILRVSINEIHAERVRDVERRWSEITGVPLSQFTKSSLIKSAQKKVYENEKVHIGTLRIKVRMGASLRREILGAISGLSLG